MYDTPSVNPAYIFYQVYTTITGIPIDPSNVPYQLMVVFEVIAVIGIVFSIVLLTFIVYIRIRTLQVEHAGFHEIERLEHLKYARAEVSQAKNPRWEVVSELASSPNESDWRRAILEADIMLGLLLTERNYAGTTLGDQLKGASREHFTTLDIAWEAHRMRNAIAHLGEAFPISERDVRATVDQYRRVFEEFDYI